MRIDHIAMYVADLERMRIFYEKYFCARSNEMYYNTRTGLRTYFLSFGGETRLEIMSRPDVAAVEKTPFRSGYIHLSIKVGTKEKVDELTELLRKDGYIIVGEPRVTGDGYYESVVLDPEGNMIELTE